MNDDYKESCEVVRYFMSSLQSIRTLTIAQGFTILSVVVYLTGESKHMLAVFAATFGILITVVLFFMRSKAFSHMETAISHAVKQEKGKGLWSGIEKTRKEKWSKPLLSFIVNRLIYIVFFLALGGAIGYNSYRMISAQDDVDQLIPARASELGSGSKCQQES